MSVDPTGASPAELWMEMFYLHVQLIEEYEYASLAWREDTLCIRIRLVHTGTVADSVPWDYRYTRDVLFPLKGANKKLLTGSWLASTWLPKQRARLRAAAQARSILRRRLREMARERQPAPKARRIRRLT